MIYEGPQIYIEHGDQASERGNEHTVATIESIARTNYCCRVFMSNAMRREDYFECNFILAVVTNDVALGKLRTLRSDITASPAHTLLSDKFLSKTSTPPTFKIYFFVNYSSNHSTLH